jgi:hypothetical protein
VTGKLANVAGTLVPCGEPLISSVSSHTHMQIRAVFLHIINSETPVEPAKRQSHSFQEYAMIL